MKKLQTENKLHRRIIYSWPVLFILLGLIFVTGREILFFYEKNSKLTSKLNINNEKIEDKRSLIDQKNHEYEYLKTEAGSEEYLRDVYSYSKPGEQIIILSSTNSSPVEMIEIKETYWDIFSKKIKFFWDNYVDFNISK